VYTLLYQQVEQFRKNRGTMAMKDIDAAQQSYEAVLEEIIQTLRPEQVARTLTPEQLTGLTPEQRFAGLTPEQILNALPPGAVEEYARKLRH